MFIEALSDFQKPDCAARAVEREPGTFRYGIRQCLRHAGVLLIAISGTFPPRLALEKSIEDSVGRDAEQRRMVQLATVQHRAPQSLAAFQTDGCSGGLSHGWEHLAERFPAFAAHFGERPPWEACCEAHDRIYWRGETERGFDKRKQADAELRACVAATGIQLGPELAQRFGLSLEVVKTAFAVTADLMYGAVRLGGVPCTDFSWRWGYGWPKCDAPSTAISPTTPDIASSSTPN